MYAGKTVSYKAIIDKVGRDFGFEQDLNDSDCLEWLAEFMAHTNSSQVMQNQISYITVVDGRGELPFDLHKIRQTALVVGVENIEDAKCGKGSIVPMRWATDNFHKRYHFDNRDYTTESAHTYTVGQNFIFTSFSNGFIAMSYDAIPTDEEGYPTIPAEQQWLEGAAYFIAHRIARKLWIKGILPNNTYQIIERDKEWYFAQAVNHSKQWNGVDQAESVKNATVRTVPDLQAHTSFFANMQLPEQRHFRSKSSQPSSVNTINSGSNPATT